MSRVNGFHVRDGLFFERQPNGDVEMTKYKDGTCTGNPIVEVVIDVDLWCSVIASESWKGETSEQFMAAQTFHDGKMHLQCKKCKCWTTYNRGEAHVCPQCKERICKQE